MARLCSCTQSPGAMGCVAKPMIWPNFSTGAPGGDGHGRHLVALGHAGRRRVPAAVASPGWSRSSATTTSSSGWRRRVRAVSGVSIATPKRATVAAAPSRIRRRQRGRDGAGEARLGRQVAAEHGVEPEQGLGERPRLVTARGAAAQLVGQGIAQVDGGAALVAAGRVAHPGRDAERQPVDRRAGRQPVAHRAEQALRQLLRAVHGDLPGAVAQRRVAEARHERRPRRRARSRPGTGGRVGAASSSISPRTSAAKPGAAMASATVSWPAR